MKNYKFFKSPSFVVTDNESNDDDNDEQWLLREDTMDGPATKTAAAKSPSVRIFIIIIIIILKRI